MTKNKNDQNIKGKHIPIMLQQTLESLNIKKGETLVDLTLNRAGHAVEFAKMLSKDGILIGNDLDSEAIKEAKQVLSDAKELYGQNMCQQFIFVNDNFKNFKENFLKLKQENVIDKNLLIDKVFVDLGLSSQELDISGRGFSFMRDEPLQMTFKDIKDLSDEDITAKYIVNNWSQELLSDIIYNFSDEKYANRIAKAIVEYRNIIHKSNKEIETTFELVKIIENAVPNFYKYGRTHFATKTFQALRMAVNDEIGSIIKLIQDLPTILNHNARVVFLSFHSTEDRIIKRHMKENLNFIPINKKVIEADNEEILNNPRSRSCKLRCYEYRSHDNFIK